MTLESHDAGGTNVGPTAGLSAIIIDDQPGLAELLAERLALGGIRCTIATSAADGLQACAEQPFDVAFVDLKLPDMSGIAAAAELKRLSREMRVILVTGFAASVDDIDIGSSQLDGVLPKPWRAAELEALLRSLGRSD